jgi:hypothetical protein
MSETYTDEAGHFWTLPELLADLDGGYHLYLTPKMCKDLAAMLRKHVPEGNAQKVMHRISARRTRTPAN